MKLPIDRQLLGASLEEIDPPPTLWAQLLPWLIWGALGFAGAVGLMLAARWAQ